jgi:hypothetical protein
MKKYNTNWDTVLYPKLVPDLGHFNVLDWQMDNIACSPCTAMLIAQGAASEVSYRFVGTDLVCPVCEKEINDAQ